MCAKHIYSTIHSTFYTTFAWGVLAVADPYILTLHIFTSTLRVWHTCSRSCYNIHRWTQNPRCRTNKHPTVSPSAGPSSGVPFSFFSCLEFSSPLLWISILGFVRALWLLPGATISTIAHPTAASATCLFCCHIEVRIAISRFSAIITQSIPLTIVISSIWIMPS